MLRGYNSVRTVSSCSHDRFAYGTHPDPGKFGSAVAARGPDGGRGAQGSPLSNWRRGKMGVGPGEYAGHSEPTGVRRMVWLPGADARAQLLSHSALPERSCDRAG